VLALALAAEPDILIADEPTTALDVTVQAEVLDLLVELRTERGVGVLLITHDLGIVARVCDRVLVLYAGEVVEQGPTRDLLGSPAHPYTRALLASAPRVGQGRAAGALPTIPGQVPSMTALPPGCPFNPRCSERLPECDTVRPAWRSTSESRGVRCALAGPDSAQR
jgi:oligopeptide/dipeptide ABC transporter ATP-binding protein